MHHRETWEYDEEAGQAFRCLFNREKAKGCADGEAARRVLHTVNAEMTRFKRMRNSGEIGIDAYIDAMSVLIRMAVRT
jgi:hypothetical protein